MSFKVTCSIFDPQVGLTDGMKFVNVLSMFRLSMFRKVLFFYLISFCFVLMAAKAQGAEAQGSLLKKQWESLISRYKHTNSVDLLPLPEFRQAAILPVQLYLYLPRTSFISIQDVFAQVATARQIFSLCRIAIDLTPSFTHFGEQDLTYDSSAAQEAHWLSLLTTAPAKSIPVLFLNASNENGRAGFAIVKNSPYGDFSPVYPQDPQVIPSYGVVLFKSGIDKLATWNKSRFILAHEIGHILVDKIENFYHLTNNILSHAKSADSGPRLGSRLTVDQCHIAREGAERVRR